ncbi:SPX domain-containing protein [Trametes polyzona]|nr:SPX domain-containing protein [Trametes polyzona]
MKFARYLEETQTPEWKKAYIDYRGLKKRITAIRRAHQAIAQAGKEDEPSPLPPLGRSSTSHGSEHERPSSPRSVRSISTSTRFGSLPPPLDTPASEVAHPAELKHRGQDSLPALALEERTEYHSDPGHDGDEETTRSPPPAEPNAHIRTRGRSTTVSGILGRAFSTNHYPQRANSHRGSAGIGQAARFDLRHPLPLMELLPQLTPVERAFFDKLDEELDKIESFYCEREREMRHRANLLKEQLQELQDHRRAFYEAHPAAAAPYSWLPLPLPAPVLPNILVRRRKGRQGRPAQPKAKSWKQSPNGRSDGSDETRAVAMADDVVEPEMPKTGTQQSESRSGSGEDEMAKDGESSPEGTVGRSRWRNSGAAKSVQALFQFLPVPVPGSEAQKGSDGDDEGEPSRHAHFSGSQGKHGHVGPPTMKYDPEEYQHAKKQLKKAVLECYRGLELLNNYRTLNLIGFRKALKKFEKVTNIPAQQAYTKEKIEPSAFSSGATVDSLIRDMEALFAARFARGDKKKALARLRGGAKHTSHHFSTFRTGMFLGLAVPALADGLYRSQSFVILRRGLNDEHLTFHTT